MATRVEKEYASALFDLYPKDADVENNLNQLIEVQEVISNDEDLVKFMKHPMISKEDKKNLLSQAFSSYKILDFLYVLVDNNRILNLEGIIQEYEVLYYKAKHIMPIEVVTAKELTTRQKNDVIDTLEKKFTEKINVRFTTSKEILGGIILKYNGQVLDNSCLGQLQNMKDFLKK